MSSTSFRNRLRNGTIFAVIIIFLTLIGFLLTASGMIGDVLGNFNAAAGSVQMPIINLILFLGAIGLWNGASAAKPADPDKWSKALIAGLISGVTCGLIVAVFALILGIFDAAKIDMRTYLSSLSPEAVRLFLYYQDGTTGALIHLGLFVLTGVLGGIAARGIGRGTWRKSLSNSIKQSLLSIINQPTVERVRRSPYTRFVIIGLLLMLLFILPRQWGSYWNYIMGTVGIYVLLGLGLNIIVGLSGQLVLGYVAYFAIGAYSFALLTAPIPHDISMNFWLALVIAVLMAALTGILLALPILRLRGDYLAIVTLGFGEIIRIMIRSELLIPLTAGPRGIREIAGPTLFGKPFTSDIDFMYLIIIAVLLLLFLSNRLQNSRVGRAWISIREDETVAQATGVDSFKYKLLALALGAAFAGLGGALFASRNIFTGPEDHVLMVSINVLCLVIVGGMASIPGIILGAFVLKGIPEILRELALYRMLAFGGLLVLMMIVRPEGLWPASRPALERSGENQNKTPEPIKKPDTEGINNAHNS